MSDPKETRQGRGRGEGVLEEGPSTDTRPLKIPQLKRTGSDSSDSHSDESRRASGESGDGTGEPQASSSSGSGAVIRGRGGYRSAVELRTIPQNITELSGTQGKQVKLFTNFVKVSPKPGNQMYQYRIDFEPNIESVKLRRQIIRGIATIHFHDKMQFDGSQQGRSLIKLPDVETTFKVPHPGSSGDQTVQVKFKFTNNIDMGSFDMLGLYNTSMRQFLIYMGFFQIRRDFYHNDFRRELPGNHGISVVGGFRTVTNRHTAGLLMNLDAVNKYMQQISCLQILRNLHTAATRQGQNFHEAARAELGNTTVITRYNNKTYKVEDILLDLNPKSKFVDKQGKSQTYEDYYKNVWPEVTISDHNQPLILARPDRKPGPRDVDRPEPGPIHLIPELCYITHLTTQQRDDGRLKQDIIRYSQIPPENRLKSLRQFLTRLHENPQVQQHCQRWDIRYAKDVISTEGRTMDGEPICWGNNKGTPPERWQRCQNGSFDRSVRGSTMYGTVPMKQIHVIISKQSQHVYQLATEKIPQMLRQLGVNVGHVSDSKLMEGRAKNFSLACQEVSPDTNMVLVVLPSTSKDIYDAVKKTLTKERGIPSQCVTTKLLSDERKAIPACQKIAIQMACKVGGEAWILSIPVRRAMICGYDTYHDTSKKGRSVGAFVSSTNEFYSRWWSKTDAHQQLEELSNNFAGNVLEGCKKYRQVNNALPDRIIIYRDGVSEGQLDHVYNVELGSIRKALKKLKQSDEEPDIKLTVVIVTKRVGARFFAEGSPIQNPLPGTVVDSTVTRAERFEFYLVSQATRQGTVAPTLYNIIWDFSGLKPSHHQMLAYKLCHLYYNWTGTVRVPAPCQYAHKLAQLVGEHIHESPNSRLDSLLHFL